MMEVKPGQTSLVIPSIVIVDNATGSPMTGLTTTSGIVWAYRFESASTWTPVTILGGTLGTFSSGTFVNNGTFGGYQICPPNASIPSSDNQKVVHQLLNGTASGLTMTVYQFTLLGVATHIVDASGYPIGNAAASTGGTFTTLSGSMGGSIGGNLLGGIGGTLNTATAAQVLSASQNVVLSSTQNNITSGIWMNVGTTSSLTGYTTPPTASAIANQVAATLFTNGSANTLTVDSSHRAASNVLAVNNSTSAASNLSFIANDSNNWFKVAAQYNVEDHLPASNFLTIDNCSNWTMQQALVMGARFFTFAETANGSTLTIAVPGLGTLSVGWVTNSTASKAALA